MKILICVLLLIGTQAKAKDVKCIVVNSTNDEKLLVGGILHLSLNNGNITWSKENSTISITNNSEVSQFKANRNHCSFGKQDLISGDEILAVWRDFNSCVHRQNNQVGYVSTKFSADFRSKDGRYYEIFATASGPIPYMELELSNCKVIE
ncbi:hypothetical protein K2P97_13435 [bacterium]|nr:hypothetical protein [bacterium]